MVLLESVVALGSTGANWGGETEPLLAVFSSHRSPAESYSGINYIKRQRLLSSLGGMCLCFKYIVTWPIVTKTCTTPVITSKLYLPPNASITQNNNSSQATEATAGQSEPAITSSLQSERTLPLDAALEHTALEQVGFPVGETELLPARLLLQENGKVGVGQRLAVLYRQCFCLSKKSQSNAREKNICFFGFFSSVRDEDVRVPPGFTATSWFMLVKPQSSLETGWSWSQVMMTSLLIC